MSFPCATEHSLFHYQRERDARARADDAWEIERAILTDKLLAGEPIPSAARRLLDFTDVETRLFDHPEFIQAVRIAKDDETESGRQIAKLTRDIVDDLVSSMEVELRKRYEAEAGHAVA